MVEDGKEGRREQMIQEISRESMHGMPVNEIGAFPFVQTREEGHVSKECDWVHAENSCRSWPNATAGTESEERNVPFQINGRKGLGGQSLSGAGRFSLFRL